MSNNQWNNGQADSQWQPQNSANEWGEQPQQPQGGQDWNQGQSVGATEWTTAQEQGQQPVQDWNPAAGQQDWNQAPAAQGADWNAQQPQATEWGTQPQAQASAQDWNQGAVAQPQGQPLAQDWNQQPSQGYGSAAPAGGFAPQPYAQQQWGQQPSGGGGFGNIFDFSFNKSALPGAAGIIFLVSVIGLVVMWVFDFISLLTSGGTVSGIEYGKADAMSILKSLIGGLAMLLVKIVLIRAFLEGMCALVKAGNKDENAAR